MGASRRAAGKFGRRLVGLTLAVVVSGACGGGLTSFDGAVYRNGSVGFRVGRVPAGWAPINVPNASLAYRDDAHEASALVNGRCGAKDGDTPLLALNNHLVMGTTEREIVTQETIPFDAREALHTRMNAKLDGVPRSFDIYVLKKDGCVYDFVYVAPPALLLEGVDAFEAFVREFRTLPGSGAS